MTRHLQMLGREAAVMPGRSSRKRVERELISQVLSLAASDFKSRFSGSYLGIFWGVIQPLSTIILFWFVFQVGFRSNPVDDVPFMVVRRNDTVEFFL